MSEKIRQDMAELRGLEQLHVKRLWYIGRELESPAMAFRSIRELKHYC